VAPPHPTHALAALAALAAQHCVAQAVGKGGGQFAQVAARPHKCCSSAARFPPAWTRWEEISPQTNRPNSCASSRRKLGPICAGHCLLAALGRRSPVERRAGRKASAACEQWPRRIDLRNRSGAAEIGEEVAKIFHTESSQIVHRQSPASSRPTQCAQAIAHCLRAAGQRCLRSCARARPAAAPRTQAVRWAELRAGLCHAHLLVRPRPRAARHLWAARKGELIWAGEPD